VFPCKDPTITDVLRRDNMGRVICAMPDNLFDRVANVVEAASSLQPQRSYLDQSTVHKFGVRNVPPKVDTKLWPDLDAVINSPLNRMNHLQPERLIDENICGNEGLLSIVREIYDKNGMADGSAQRYTSLNVDENIFIRIIKVQYPCFCCV
jgi:hypothetical protein